MRYSSRELQVLVLTSWMRYEEIRWITYTILIKMDILKPIRPKWLIYSYSVLWTRLKTSFNICSAGCWIDHSLARDRTSWKLGCSNLAPSILPDNVKIPATFVRRSHWTGCFSSYRKARSNAFNLKRIWAFYKHYWGILIDISIELRTACSALGILVVSIRWLWKLSFMDNYCLNWRHFACLRSCFLEQTFHVY